jgi:hypothetical protein
MFERVHRGKLSSWAYPLLFSMWRQSGLSILPSVNLVSNIGFQQSGTHTTRCDDPMASIPAKSLHRLLHPSAMVRDRRTDIDLFLNCHLRRRGARRAVWRVREEFRLRVQAA